MIVTATTRLPKVTRRVKAKNCTDGVEGKGGGKATVVVEGKLGSGRRAAASTVTVEHQGASRRDMYGRDGSQIFHSRSMIQV